jgi:hypothetical protein
VEGDCDFEDEGLFELPFREGLGRTTTSWGWLDDLMGMRVMVGPVARWRVVVCFFLFLLELEVVLLLGEQSLCFWLPHFGHDAWLRCCSCNWDWLSRWYS